MCPLCSPNSGPYKKGTFCKGHSSVHQICRRQNGWTQWSVISLILKVHLLRDQELKPQLASTLSVWKYEGINKSILNLVLQWNPLHHPSKTWPIQYGPWWGLVCIPVVHKQTLHTQVFCTRWTWYCKYMLVGITSRERAREGEHDIRLPCKFAAIRNL